MKTASIRDLRYDFPRVEAWLKLGEPVQITRRSRPIAVITPTPAAPRPEHPDYAGRARRIFGKRVFSAAEVEDMRAFETGEP
jgi:antitoxin (DNA-binding transcriptional repressor) of toxin-antitoxin stability system